MKYPRILILLSVLLSVLSCVTVTEKPEFLSNKALMCEKVISKSVALLQIQSDVDVTDEVKKTSEGNNVTSPLEQRLQSTRCFDIVKFISDEKLAKDFERTIKIQVKTKQFSGLKTTGRIIWLFTSASTLFLLPYFHNDNYEVILTDSKTDFTKSYFFKSHSVVHVFYFFTDWTLDDMSSEIFIGIFEDYFNDLKGKT